MYMFSMYSHFDNHNYKFIVYFLDDILTLFQNKDAIVLKQRLWRFNLLLYLIILLVFVVVYGIVSLRLSY